MGKVRFGFGLLINLAFLVGCGQVKTDSLHVSDIWARPGLAGGNSAVYFVVQNQTDQEDTLLMTNSDIASAVELHMTSMQDGNMQMMQQPEVAVPVGETEFKPGGLHVMLIDLDQDLKPGDTFMLTLNFRSAGAKSLSVIVSDP